MIRNDRIINSLMRDDMVEKLVKDNNIGITEARNRISEMSFKEYRAIDEASADIVPPSGQPIAPGATQSGTPQTTKPSATTQPTTTTPSQGTADPRGVQVRNPVTGKMEWMQPTNAMAGKQGTPAPGAQQVAEDDTPANPLQYEVIDRQTGKVVGGPYSSAKRARSVRDKKDNEYGAYRYTARPIAAPVKEDNELARMKHLAGIKEDASGGSTGAGAIAMAPTAMGSMKKRQYTAEQPKEYTPKEAPKTIIGDTKPAQASGELSANLAVRGKKTASRTNNGFKK